MRVVSSAIRTSLLSASNGRPPKEWRRGARSTPGTMPSTSSQETNTIWPRPTGCGSGRRLEGTMTRMKLRAGASAAILALALCGAAVAAPAARPQYGAWGFDLAGMDKATQPGDDIFRYANGTYQDHLVIPSDRSSYSLRAAAAEQTEKNVHELLEEAAAHPGPDGTDRAKIGGFYAAI